MGTVKLRQANANFYFALHILNPDGADFWGVDQKNGGNAIQMELYTHLLLFCCQFDRPT